VLSFPLSLFLIPYAIIVAAIVFFSFFNLKNLIRYRPEDMVSFTVCFIFLAGLAVIAYFSYQYLLPINWKELVEFNFSIKMPTL